MGIKISGLTTQFKELGGDRKTTYLRIPPEIAIQLKAKIDTDYAVESVLNEDGTLSIFLMEDKTGNKQ